MRHSQLFRFVLSCFTVHTPDSEFGRALDLAFIHTKNLGTGPECFAIDASERLTLCILLCFVYAYTISGSLPYWDSCANLSHIQSFWRKFLAPRGADFSQKAIIVFPLSAIRGVSKSQLSRQTSNFHASGDPRITGLYLLFAHPNSETATAVSVGACHRAAPNFSWQHVTWSAVNSPPLE
ncbi:hypothetical protein BON22_1668 [Cyberlindnera fabianii]|uniref:Uncharacterized protein n=1 Tax=Cyberlindnera fabianii TaxID=36022 RepID=A0A1V2LAE5_CYBFA|nr:hypothetical protein BON22_1668 [Cyberlindnera fabianii]